MAVNIIEKVAETACPELVAKSNAGQAASDGWNVLQRLGVIDQAQRTADLWFGW